MPKRVINGYTIIAERSVGGTTVILGHALVQDDPSTHTYVIAEMHDRDDDFWISGDYRGELMPAAERFKEIVREASHGA